MNEVVPVESIISKIFLIRGQKVMLDSDLVKLYNVEVKQLKRAVNRNICRFPPDFMFELSKGEYNSLRYQFGTLKRGQHSKHLSYAFTELGVAMLSSVLNSDQAIEINIIIMRAFVKLRELISTSQKVEEKLKEIDVRLGEHDEQIINIMETINMMLLPPEKPKQKNGFLVKERKQKYSAH